MTDKRYTVYMFALPVHEDDTAHARISRKEFIETKLRTILHRSDLEVFEGGPDDLPWSNPLSNPKMDMMDYVDKLKRDGRLRGESSASIDISLTDAGVEYVRRLMAQHRIPMGTDGEYKCPVCDAFLHQDTMGCPNAHGIFGKPKYTELDDPHEDERHPGLFQDCEYPNCKRARRDLFDPPAIPDVGGRDL